MAIGERIKFFRNLRGITQKHLGMSIGFAEKTADVRMAQYESGTRKPKKKLVNELANALDVSPQALNVPDIDSYIGLMHTLFALEDLYGFKVSNLNGELCLTLDKTNHKSYISMVDMLGAWQQETDRFERGEISKAQYDEWRYNYPRIKAEQIRAQLDELREAENADTNV